MVTGKVPFEHMDQYEVILGVMKEELSLSTTALPDAPVLSTMIGQCLNDSADERPSFDRIIIRLQLLKNPRTSGSYMAALKNFQDV